MKQELLKNKEEQVVIPDECGDTMWDAVLQQEVKKGGVNVNSNNTCSSLNNIDAVKVCDATEAK